MCGRDFKRVTVGVAVLAHCGDCCGCDHITVKAQAFS